MSERANAVNEDLSTKEGNSNQDDPKNGGERLAVNVGNFGLNHLDLPCLHRNTLFEISESLKVCRDVRQARLKQSSVKQAVQHVYLQGGAGIGKSYICGIIKNKIIDDSGRDSKKHDISVSANVLKTDSLAEVRSEIIRLVDKVEDMRGGDQVLVVVVDDIDRLYAKHIQLEDPSGRASDRLETLSKITNGFRYLFSEMKEEGHLVVTTGRQSPNEMMAKYSSQQTTDGLWAFWSDIFAEWKTTTLSKSLWASVDREEDREEKDTHTWDDCIRKDIKIVYNKCNIRIKSRSDKHGGESDAIDELQDSLLLWSGGHPSLTGSALKAVCSEYHETKEGSAVGASQVSNVFIRGMTENGIKHVQRAVLQLNELGPDVNAAARNILHVIRSQDGVVRDFTKGKDESTRDSSLKKEEDFLSHGDSISAQAVTNRKALDSLFLLGLVYKDEERQLRIPGLLVKEEIDSLMAPPRLEQDDEEKGRIALERNRKEREIRLKGSMWQIARALAESRDYLSIEELQRRAELGSPASARSAIKRLQDKLEKEDLGDLIQNKYGRGYRFSVSMHVNLLTQIGV